MYRLCLRRSWAAALTNLLQIWVLIWQATVSLMMKYARRLPVRRSSAAITRAWTLWFPVPDREEVRKIELLLQQAHAEITDRKVVPAALEKEKETNGPAAAMELPDGRIVCGKTSDLLGASSALLLNALKELAGVDHEQHVISPDAIHPIQQLKTKYLGSKNPRLHH